jgi:hypothetical protein
MQITTIGIDLAKTVFQLHAVDANGATVVRQRDGPRYSRFLLVSNRA